MKIDLNKWKSDAINWHQSICVTKVCDLPERLGIHSDRMFTLIEVVETKDQLLNEVLSHLVKYGDLASLTEKISRSIKLTYSPQKTIGKGEVIWLRPRK